MQRNISIQQAIRKGLQIDAISWGIVVVSIFIMIWLFWEHCFGSAFLVLAAGILLSTMRNSYATLQWRIWAYTNVADIHQLQRSAEISGVLTINTIKYGLGKGDLGELMQRFDEEQVFVDDPSVPPKTAFYATPLLSDNRFLFALCDEGIEDTRGFVLPWDKIWNDHVAMTGALRSATANYGFQPESTGVGPYHFRFDSEYGTSDYLVSSLKTEAWKIDLLLYIYRGRYNSMKQAKLSSKQLLH